jgi:hypothetical protein
MLLLVKGSLGKKEKAPASCFVAKVLAEVFAHLQAVAVKSRSMRN